MMWGLKGGISIDADSWPPRYVIWCCGGICHELLTFIQIGWGHTVYAFIQKILQNWLSSKFICIIWCFTWLCGPFKCGKNLIFQSPFLASKKTYRVVASSRPVHYSILKLFGQRSQYISIKFPLHKPSENLKICY